MLTKSITAARAARHEALYPRLAALEKQLVPIAGKKPELIVPPPIFRAARALLREVQALLGRRQLLMDLRGAVDFATLAVGLGQARMALEGFEAAHARWDNDQNGLCWQLRDGDKLPVRRKLPAGAPPPRSPAEQREQEDIREKLVKRIEESRRHAYSVGYRDATQGKPEDDNRFNH